MMIPFRFRKAAFLLLKGGISRRKRRHIAGRFVVGVENKAYVMVFIICVSFKVKKENTVYKRK